MVYSDLEEEWKLWQKGYRLICGVDEVGRGCFAGPVVAGAVVFSQDCQIPGGIADSKLLKPRQRQRLAAQIKKCALSWAVGEIPVRDINRFGVGRANQMAFRKAVRSLAKKPDFVLVDAFYIRHLQGLGRKNQRAIIKGDRTSISIAAASIIAKVYRDNLMKKLAKKYPLYGFAKHKGYGTKDHQEAIRQYGLTPLHRRSFKLEKFLGLTVPVPGLT